MNANYQKKNNNQTRQYTEENLDGNSTGEHEVMLQSIALLPGRISVPGILSFTEKRPIVLKAGSIAEM